MNKVISSPKTYAIRNYLLKCVRELPPEPTRLMTEEVLCKKFRVNRETVRSAIHDLELSRVVSHLPGRKGIFSNPAFSHSGIRIAGLVNGRPGEPYIHHCQSSLFSQLVFRTENSFPVIYQFPILSEEPEQAVAQIEDYSFDFMIWSHFSELHNIWLDRIDSIIRKGYPLIVMNTQQNGFPQKATSSNMIGIDLEKLERKKVDFLIRSGCGNLVYAGGGNPVGDSFAAALTGLGMPLRKRSILSNVLIQPEEISRALRETSSSAIFCEGGYQRYRAAFEAISGNPDFSAVRLFCADNADSHSLKKEFPSVNAILSKELDFSLEDMADELVRRITDITNNNSSRFDNVLIA